MSTPQNNPFAPSIVSNLDKLPDKLPDKEAIRTAKKRSDEIDRKLREEQMTLARERAGKLLVLGQYSRIHT